jgi:PKHD-type hydroxylase
MSALETHHFVYAFPPIGGKTAQPFHSDLELDTNSGLDMVRCSSGVFSAEECRRIVELGDARPRMSGGLDLHRERYRDSHVAWIEPHADSHWLYHKIAALFGEVNAHCAFELLGLVDPLQYTVYGGGQHFDWHIDLGAGGACVRKLSMTVQLTDGTQYQGGDLQFLDGADPGPQRAIGTVTVFPAFVAHRVTPVTSGIRRSLVAWACGPSFR